MNKTDNILIKICHTVNRLWSFLSSCHPVIWSFSHSVTWSLGHLVTRSLSHSCHPVIRIFNMLTNGHTTSGSTGLLRRQIERKKCCYLFFSHKARDLYKLRSAGHWLQLTTTLSGQAELSSSPSQPILVAVSALSHWTCIWQPWNLGSRPTKFFVR